MKQPRALVTVLLMLAAMFVAGCSDEQVGLRVIVITDFVPGAQFDVVETDVYPYTEEGVGRAQSTGGGLLVSAVAEARFGMPYAFGQTVAEFASLEPGDLVVRVRLKSSESGEVVAQRRVRRELSSDYTLRVYIEQACADVECPGSGSVSNTECQAGRCVDPRCNPQDESTREYCPQVRFCNRETDCAPVSACAVRSCMEGVCVGTPTLPPICNADEWCDPRRGCQSGAPVVDDENPCGRLCFNASTPCIVGFWKCHEGRVTCETLYHREVGTECDETRVCNEAAECVECIEGGECRIGCQLGSVACDPDTGAPTCNLRSPQENATPGASCAGEEVVCYSHTTCPGAGVCSDTGACEVSEDPEIVIEFPDDATQTRLFTDESGDTDRFTVRLSGAVATSVTEPAGRVEIALSTRDAGGAADETEISLSTTTLVFTRDTAATPQLVTVTGLDDAVNDGDVDFVVRVAVSASSDARYASLSEDIGGTNASVCPSGTGDCNGITSDGCETNITSSATHCGVCGNACSFANATPRCMNGGCVIDRCDDGYSDCDGNPFNGCEVRVGDACSLFEGCQTGVWACGDPDLSGTTRAYCDVDFVAEPGTPCGSGSGFTCDDVGECNTCIEGDSCTPPGGDPCAGGVVSCMTGRAVCSPTGGNRATNTPCGPRSLCSPTGVCTNVLVSRNVFCGSALTNGNEICRAASAAFAGATAVHGWSWGQCAGPLHPGSRNAAGMVTADPCGEWSADGLDCLDRFVGARDCAGEPFYFDAELGRGPRWGFRITDIAGDGFLTFEPAPLISRWGCNGWNPGWSVRALCRFPE